MLSKERLGEIRDRCAVTARGYEQLDIALADCKDLLSEIDRLRSALSFYADEENYEMYHQQDTWEASAYGTNDVMEDNGARARDVLGGGK